VVTNKNYFFKVTREEIVKKIVAHLKPRKKEFDAIAVSGYSMSLIAPIVASKLNKELVLVRKYSDNRHSSFMAEGIHKQRCIVIDDCVDSGATMSHVIEHVKELLEGSVVGIVLYNDWREPNESACGVPIWLGFN